jgi:predicted permease
MDILLKDIRYGLRALIKRPAFTVVVVITLALGIGANTAIFTLVNAVLMKSLPISRPEELVLFSGARGEGTSRGDPIVGEWELFSFDAYQYMRNHNQSFQDIAAFRSGESRLSVALPGAATVQRAQGHLVSGNFFSALGVPAMLGRTFTPEDDKVGAPGTVVISNRYWQQQLGSDQAIVGKNIQINNSSFTVIGVTPVEFFGVRVRRPADFWIPLSFQPQIEVRASALEDKRVFWLSLMGRLKPGVDIASAQASSNLALRQFLTEDAGSQITQERQRDIEKTYLALADGSRGISGLRFIYSKPLQMLMAIVAMVLLIACANVGSLFLSRAAARKAEMSLRLALGASRIRIIRQLLVESLLLAFAGGVGGVLLAMWGVKILVGLVTRETPLDTRPDLWVMGFTAAISIASGLVFGLVPAIRASRTDLAISMKEKTKISGRGFRFGLPSALVITQVCLSMVLLTGAGLFARSLLNLQQEDLGFNRNNVLLVSVDTRLAGYKPAELAPLYQRLLAQVKAVPGVSEASVASYSPLSGTLSSSSISIVGYKPAPDERMNAEDLLIGPGFAQALGIRMLQGREIDITDTLASKRVVVVNQAFADRFLKNQNPLGRILGDDDPKSRREIVGVIGNIKSGDAREAPREAVYGPILQSEDQSAYSATLLIRTKNEAELLTPSIREAISQVDSKMPIYGVTTMREQLQSSFRQDGLIARLMSFFGLLALLLACVGLYGVMANSVVRRTSEIGIRMALGAQRGNILWMVMRDTLWLLVVGLVIGIPLSLGAASLVSNQLFGLKATDPVSLIAAAAFLTVVAILAGYLPARRASRVNPLVALRDE